MKNHKFSSKFSKFALGALIASSIVSSAVAVNLDGFFVGAEGNYIFKSNAKIDAIAKSTLASDVSLNAKDNIFKLGLKIGYDFDNFRAYMSYLHNFQAKDDSSVNIANYLPTTYNMSYSWESDDFAIGADWTPKFSLGGIDFKAILGAFAGISFLDVKYENDIIVGGSLYASYDTDFSQNGFVYGVRLGLIHEINKQNEIEFGLKFDQSKYKDKDINLASNISYGIQNTKRTNMGLFVGYNYKF